MSLDISNAFNILPWVQIRGVLARKGLPQYLQKVIGDYLRSRRLWYWDRDGSRCERGVNCGVPQGSVLGPMLWNLAFDNVLRTALPPAVILSATQTIRSCWPGRTTGGPP